MKFILFITLILSMQTVSAAVNCKGTIKSVYKWNSFDTISILVEMPGIGDTRWISMPTKSDESMALMAFASKNPVHIYMADADITQCIAGWENNRKLKGYFLVSH